MRPIHRRNRNEMSFDIFVSLLSHVYIYMYIISILNLTTNTVKILDAGARPQEEFARIIVNYSRAGKCTHVSDTNVVINNSRGYLVITLLDIE